MYVVTVSFEVDPGAAGRFRKLVLAQARNALQREPDCHQFDVCTDPHTPQRLFLYEVYSDRAAFEAHLASAHFCDFDAAVAPLVTSKKVEILTRL